MAGVLLLAGCGRSWENPPDDDEMSAVRLSEFADRADTKQYAKACMDSVALPPAKEGEDAPKRTVVVPPRLLDDGVYKWASGRYTLETDKSELTLKTSLAIEYLGQPGESDTALRTRMETVRTCFGVFFANHGLKLDLTLATGGGDGVKTIQVREMGARGTTYNMDNWAFGINSRPMEDVEACTTMAHEFLHILGLYDEYRERGTRRELGEPNSIMRTAHCPPDYVKLYPRHLRTILAPLCSSR